LRESAYRRRVRTSAAPGRTIEAGKNVVPVARNAGYFGDNVPAAHRAMATLR
jgi:hypothetical protein